MPRYSLGVAVDRRSLLDASGRHDLRSPVVYLDHSSLVDAFEGKQGTGKNPAINAELAAVVEDVARRGTLCLSVVHVIETVPRSNRDEALAIAKWLDGLNPLWFQMEGSIEDELANEVRRRLGLRTAPVGRLPIHHAMTAAMSENIKGLTHEAVADILSAPDLASLIRKVHGNATLSGNHANAKTYSVELARRTYDDRSSIPAGTAPEQVAAVTGVKFCRYLQVEARRAIVTAPVAEGEDYPVDPEISKAVIEALEDPNAIPLTKIHQHMLGEVGAGIHRSDPHSGSFKKRFGSFIWDTRHSLASAVVDVFTCDSYVDSVLTNFRQNHGMERQISLLGRDRAALVAELRRQST